MLQIIGQYRWENATMGERITEPMFKVTGLEAEQEYEFRVAAENKAGIGPFANTAQPIVTRDIKVGNAPEILSPLTDVVGTAGKPMRIECDVSQGHPPASFKW